MRRAALLVAVVALGLPGVALAGHHTPPPPAPTCDIPAGANPAYHPCVVCDPNPPAGGSPIFHPPCPPDPCRND